MSAKKQRKYLPHTIGADPELFLRHVKSKELVSAHDIFPGTKAEPFPVAGGAGAVQVDGVAVELNITPTSNKEEFLRNIYGVTKVANFILRKRNPQLKIVAVPTAVFDGAYFDSLPDSVKELGCSPDYDAFTGMVNPSPRTNEPFRTGAGHIHAGWTEGEDLDNPHFIEDCNDHMKQLAAALYIPSLAWDQDQKRRTLYGRIGAMRPKPYGGEWRALSNAWLQDASIAEFVFESAKHALDIFASEKLYKEPEFEKFLQRDEHTATPTEILDYSELLQKFGFPSIPKTPETIATIYQNG